ncbi:MAG: YggT family protein [Anaerolineae bacterium]|nr:YggT family protein [Anaerolineae bacterium]
MTSVFQLIFLLLTVYEFIMLARVLLSWIPDVDYNNPLIRLLIDLTEPVLRPIRQMIPPTSGFDLSPVIVLLIITVVLRLLRF